MTRRAPVDRAEWLHVPVARSDRPALIDSADLGIVGAYRWHLHTNGYVSTEVRRSGVRSRIYMHRLILDPGPGLTVDHDNRDKLDNRRANLRPATSQQQAANQGRRADNTSGYRGVSPSKGGRWQATIRIRGRSINLGATYPTPEAAAAAYDAAALEAFGEFASLNSTAARS